MTATVSESIVARIVSATETVTSEIESVFSRVGNDLARGHAMYQALNQKLVALSGAFSSGRLDGVSSTLKDIAGLLRRSADALPTESALLADIAARNSEASVLLRKLVQDIQMITTIARSARIQAVAVEDANGDFENFTREVFDLARRVQGSIEGCLKDHATLSRAIDMALKRQLAFERSYSAQMVSVSTDLGSTYSAIQDIQRQGEAIAQATTARTAGLANTVGECIMSLQSGDSTRQRLEHIRDALRAVETRATLVPSDATHGGEIYIVAPFVRRLQVDHVNETMSALDRDIGVIDGALTALSCDISGLADQRHSAANGGTGGLASFLETLNQRISQAFQLIERCEDERQHVDRAVTELEVALKRFRDTIAELGESVIDIVLIGMNAGLKASHLGAKGQALVVIANELKATADQISGGAAQLAPVFDRIEQSNAQLLDHRSQENISRKENLVDSMTTALWDIRQSDEMLRDLVAHLADESARFAQLMAHARTHMSGIKRFGADVVAAATELELTEPLPEHVSAANGDLVAVFADRMLLPAYTMEVERNIHSKFLRRFGIQSAAVEKSSDASSSEADDVLFF